MAGAPSGAVAAPSAAASGPAAVAQIGLDPALVSALRSVLAHPALGRVAAPLPPELLRRVTAPRLAALVRAVRDLAASLVQAADGAAPGLLGFFESALRAVEPLARPAPEEAAAAAALSSAEVAEVMAAVAEGVVDSQYRRFVGVLSAVFQKLLTSV